MNSGGILPPSECRELVRVLTNEILHHTTNLSKKLVRIVAHDCITKFAVFEDTMDNTKLGSGYESLAYQIDTEIVNLRRKQMVISNDLCAPEVKIKNEKIQFWIVMVVLIGTLHFLPM